MFKLISLHFIKFFLNDDVVDIEKLNVLELWLVNEILTIGVHAYLAAEDEIFDVVDGVGDGFVFGG